MSRPHRARRAIALTALALPLASAGAAAQEPSAAAPAVVAPEPALDGRVRDYAAQVALLQGQLTDRQQRYGALAAPDSEKARRLREELQRALAELENLRRAHEGEAKSLDQIVRSLRALAERVRRLEARLPKGAPAAPPPQLPETASRAELERALADLLVRVKQLEELIAKTLAPPTGPGLQQEVSLTGKKMIPVMLFGGRMVPRQDRYFKIIGRGFVKTPNGEQVPAAKVERADAGQALDEALTPNGLLTRLMNEAKGSDAYFKFFVCADAIETFRQTRDAVAAQGFAYAWDTERDAPFVIRTGPTQGNDPRPPDITGITGTPRQPNRPE